VNLLERCDAIIALLDEASSLAAMSFSFAVTAGPAADFADAAEKARAAYAASIADNDYMLTQLASGLVEEAIALATEGVAKLGDGTAGASLSGHAVPAGEAGTNTLSVSLTCTVSATPAS
jgi:hypothetical protein